ncbi:MAG: HDIG domain-containing metalloprotein [Acidobacteriota bacterium]|nr:HDIG domain-containing metalloprotein [Acidobacteriota bacterium]
MDVNGDEARQLLHEYTQSESLIKHALAVEAAMRAYARKFGKDEEKWGIAGLLHDFDYEQNPDPEDHPRVGAAILEARGYPEDIIYAIKAHADHMHLPRESLMDKALFAVDELCGFLTAATLVRPEKKVAELPVKSVKKRLKDKAFARNVSREDIRAGAEGLEVELEEHIAFVRDAMVEVAEQLGLAGLSG